MSACNVILTPTAGYLATDTAVYTPDYELVTFNQKVRAMPHIRCAFGGRGSLAFLEHAATALSLTANRERCIDGLLPKVQEVLTAVRGQCLEYMAQAGQTDAQAFLIGWSEQEKRVVGYEFDYFEENRDRFEPRRLSDSAYFAPGEDASLGPQYRPDYKAWPLKNVFRAPAEFMTHVMKRQRQAAIDLGDSNEAWRGFIGGDLMLTEVTRHGVKQRSVFRWPDEIGDTLHQHFAAVA